MRYSTFSTKAEIDAHALTESILVTNLLYRSYPRSRETNVCSVNGGNTICFSRHLLCNTVQDLPDGTTLESGASQFHEKNMGKKARLLVDLGEGTPSLN